MYICIGRSLCLNVGIVQENRNMQSLFDLFQVKRSSLAAIFFWREAVEWQLVSAIFEFSIHWSTYMYMICKFSWFYPEVHANFPYPTKSCSFEENLETPLAAVGARRFCLAVVNKQFNCNVCVWLHIVLLYDDCSLLYCTFLTMNRAICCPTIIMSLYWRVCIKVLTQ